MDPYQFMPVSMSQMPQQRFTYLPTNTTAAENENFITNKIPLSRRFPNTPPLIDAVPRTEVPTKEDFEHIRRLYGLPKPSPRRGTQNFLDLLWSYLAINPYNPINPPPMYWSPCGAHIIIPDEPTLAASSIVKSIDKSYQSFARQFNIYGFRRISIHEITRGRSDICPEGSKVWFNPYLGRHCSLEILKFVPRHASNKKRSKSKEIMGRKAERTRHRIQTKNSKTFSMSPASSHYSPNSPQTPEGLAEMVIPSSIVPALSFKQDDEHLTNMFNDTGALNYFFMQLFN